MRKHIGSKLVLVFAAILCLGISHAWGATVYVNASLGAGGDGTSWDTAFADLQIALDIAVSGDEIWVAVGTYKPSDGTDRSATFNLKTGVKIYGGFAGDETSFGERSPDPELTILSGDIGTENDDTDNSYHVVYAYDVTDAILDGFTVTRGRGEIVGYNNGAGMYNYESALTVSNCIFSDNQVAVTANNAYGYGGGMYNYNSAPIVRNCTFIGNRAGEGSFSSKGYGGGMYNEGYFGSDLDRQWPVITGCTFKDNTRGGWNLNYVDGGGGMYNFYCSPTIDRCTFDGNYSRGYGGAMLNRDGSRPIITNSIFTANRTSGYGGAIFNYGSDSTILNCTFYRNGWSSVTAYPETWMGGAIAQMYGRNTIANTLFVENAAAVEGGAFFFNYTTVRFLPTLINCLFYENLRWHPGHSDPYERVPLPSHIYGPIDDDSTNNLYDIDPLLVDPQNGDFHLQEGSPAIDGGVTEKFAKQRWLPLPETDFEGDKRVIDGDGSAGKASDIGADEYVPTLQELRDLIQSLATAGKIDEKLANSLLAYVDDAQAALDEGDTWTAKQVMELLIKKVKALDDSETTELILKKAEAVYGTLD